MNVVVLIRTEIVIVIDVRIENHIATLLHPTPRMKIVSIIELPPSPLPVLLGVTGI